MAETRNDGLDSAKVAISASGLRENYDYRIAPVRTTTNDISQLDSVIAVGNPRGYTNVITSGQISKVYREQASAQGPVYGMYLHTAPINSGNSGGAWFRDNSGRYELIGLNHAVALNPSTQQPGAGMGRAICVNDIVGGHVDYVWAKADKYGAAALLKDLYKNAATVK